MPQFCLFVAIVFWYSMGLFVRFDAAGIVCSSALGRVSSAVRIFYLATLTSVLLTCVLLAYSFKQKQHQSRSALELALL